MNTLDNSSTAKMEEQKKQTEPNLGATWTNTGSLNIDLDNLLMSNKNKAENAPSMNQLKSNPTSPVNQPMNRPIINNMMTPGHLQFGNMMSPNMNMNLNKMPQQGGFMSNGSNLIQMMPQQQGIMPNQQNRSFYPNAFQ